MRGDRACSASTAPARRRESSTLCCWPKPVELSDLRKFVAISETGGFRRAATQLGIQQSAISRRVRYVEETLGVSLFERHSSGVRLTIAGMRLLREARSNT